MSDAIRVVVADDQQVVREGLVALLGLLDGIEVAGAARQSTFDPEVSKRLIAGLASESPANDGLTA